MDLKQIESFVRVAELGSFTRAAAVLGIAQPLLSRNVRQLEVELRQAFLLRNGRGVTLTDAGRVLLEHGRGILHQVALAREELGRVRGGLAGRVAIGLPTSLARVLTVPLTRAFRSRMPDAAISISEGLSTALQAGLISGRLDVVVLYNAQPAPELELQAIAEEELVLVSPRTPGLAEAPPPAPLPLKQIAPLPLVIPSRPNAIRMHVEAMLATVGARLTIALEIDGVSAILDLVADGAGHAILSRNAVISSIKPSALSIRAVCDPALTTRLSMATSSLRPTTLTQRATMALLREMAAASVATR